MGEKKPPYRIGRGPEISFADAPGLPKRRHSRQHRATSSMSLGLCDGLHFGRNQQ